MVVVLSIALVLSGCAAGDNGSGENNEPVLGDVRQITHEMQVKRPIDVFLPSSNEIRQTALLQLETENRCFAEHGLTAKREQNATDLAAFVNSSLRGRVVMASFWSFFDTTNAAQYGYKRPAEDRGPLESHISGGIPAWEIISTCAERSTSNTPGQAGWSEFTSETAVLPDGGPKSAVNDSRYVSAVGNWSSCMNEKGFDYPDPLAAIGDRQWHQLETADSQEIATATADIDCKISTNLVGIGLAVQTAYDKHYIDTHREALTQFRNDLDNYLRGATKST